MQPLLENLRAFGDRELDHGDFQSARSGPNVYVNFARRGRDETVPAGCRRGHIERLVIAFVGISWGRCFGSVEKNPDLEHLVEVVTSNLGGADEN